MRVERVRKREFKNTHEKKNHLQKQNKNKKVECIRRAHTHARKLVTVKIYAAAVAVCPAAHRLGGGATGRAA